MKYQVIDNFLPTDVFERYQSILLEDFGAIPMYYSSYVGDTTDTSLYYFVHVLYHNHRPVSDFYDTLVPPLFERLSKDHDFRVPIRSKINWYPRTNEVFEHKKHIDCPGIEHNVLLFSINDCNGFTRLGDDVIVESVANRALIFDGGIHNSSTSTDVNMRCNININFL